MSRDVKDFGTEVLQRSHQIPVLVDFWAEWCGPCRILGPVLERLAEANTEKWVLAKVNTEEHPRVAAQYGVQSIPNVKLFFEGKVVGEFVGAIPEYTILQWLRKTLPGKNQKRIELAQQAVAEERTADAVTMLEEILREEPDNQNAKLLLAITVLFIQPEKAGRLIRDVDDPEHQELAEAIRTIVHLFELANRAGSLPESTVRNDYLDAIGNLQKQHFDHALERFIAVIRSDRYYDDDGGRKACIAIFKYLGEENPITQQYRREFSRSLY